MRKRYLLFFLLFVKTVAFAQTPPPGYSDPLKYYNFGAGGQTFGSPVFGLNNLVYTAGVPNFGAYTVINNTNINANNWWPVKDHTKNDGDSGYMMIGKPRNGIGDEVLFDDGVNGLCSGTSYELSAYLMNVSKVVGGTSPDISLRVVEVLSNGSPGTTYRTNYTLPKYSVNPDTLWSKITLQFTASPGIDNVRIYIVCNTTGGPNLDDFAIDDIAINAIGQKIDAVFTGPGNQVLRETCAATSESIEASATTPVNGNVIQWQEKVNNGLWEPIAGANSTTLSRMSSTTPGIYSYRAASGPPGQVDKFSCNVVSNEISIRVKPEVYVTAGADKLFYRTLPPVRLDGASNSNDVVWTSISGDDVSTLSSTTTASTFASPNQTTTYKLTARSDDSNTCGPEQVDFVTVLVADKVEPKNTFTPNGDGINDKWIIEGLDSYPSPVVRVYTRSGQLMYRSVGGSHPWDGTYKGKNVPAGVYYYIIDLNLAGMKLSGPLTVLR
ncbi:gliding motility-associated C-terminal domain-containing protein [Mucilaginibacter auburnensis]|uniref:Gliding motility-associated-like protein n=1 Tax=Mucilaginibacter auburnensis TaxID=1457233 RepID=A0A2H9VSK2_9SPHI|nr:gliding motility-associated C-terminal domain-containing protein [Mucilaginibacter auburnensis]PJJ83806.1 gliding motility-associated-like protein [Mucilaginibacter auburnensis]